MPPSRQHHMQRQGRACTGSTVITLACEIYGLHGRCYTAGRYYAFVWDGTRAIQAYTPVRHFCAPLPHSG